MKNAGNVRKHVENNFYGNINHFYKIEGNVTYNGPMSFNLYDNGGPQITKSETTTDQAISNEIIIKGVRKCQEYFWAGAAWAVIFRVLQSDFGDKRSVNQFEKEMFLPSEGLNYQCTPRTVAMGIQNNSVLRNKPETWEREGAKSRIIELRDAFRKALEELI